MAALVLSQAAPGYINVILVLLSMSLVYVGGMFMNDAIDAEWDKKNSIPRPIACGEANSRTVFKMAALCFVISLLALSFLEEGPQVNEGLALISCFILIGLVALYNWIHKKFRYASVVMGFCRAMVYITTAAALGDISLPVVVASLSLAAYITGLTALARAEHLNSINQLGLPLAGALFILSTPLLVSLAISLDVSLSAIVAVVLLLWMSWQLKKYFFSDERDVKAGVGGLLAIIPLLDAMFMVSQEAIFPALFCVALFFMIPIFHRQIAGT